VRLNGVGSWLAGLIIDGVNVMSTLVYLSSLLRIQKSFPHSENLRSDYHKNFILCLERVEGLIACG
jgi:hypothetical protein